MPGAGDIVRAEDALPGEWSIWTPTVTASSGTFTTVSGTGRYLETPGLVMWTVFILITTVGTASGSVLFTLPTAALVSTDRHIGEGRRTSDGLGLQAFLNTATSGGILKYDNTSAIAASSLILSGFYEPA